MDARARSDRAGVAEALGLPRRIDDSAGVALTFDDGPHPEGTPAVLDALEAADAKATFFLCGEQVERHPSLAAEIAAAGHVVAIHGYRHRNMLRLAPRTFVDDLERGIAAIEDAVGRRPEIYRPPYGIFSYPGMVEVRGPGTPLTALVTLGSRLASPQAAGEDHRRGDA